MNKNNPPLLLTDFLSALQVPFTYDYSAKRFSSIPFSTLFGLSKLLKEYGVDSEGYHLNDKSEISSLQPPFLASTGMGIVIVTHIGNKSLSYLSQGEDENVAISDFNKAWSGDVLLAYPATDAAEPDYARHKRIEMLMHSKKWVMSGCFLFLFAYLFIANEIYRNLSVILLTLFDIGGLWFTWMLVQKSMNIHTRTAAAVCRVLQEGGCDSILAMKASKFFGLFGWSEVGFSYFSVSLIAMLLLPEILPWLALCNLCCLPFTIWSIWYQKFKAKHWCTLCVCVQLSLWALFFCYLGGGWLRLAWPPSPVILALGAAYLGVMLAINSIETHYGKATSNKSSIA